MFAVCVMHTAVSACATYCVKGLHVGHSKALSQRRRSSKGAAVPCASRSANTHGALLRAPLCNVRR